MIEEKSSYDENKVKYQIMANVYGETYTLNGSISNDMLEKNKYSREKLLDVLQDIIEGNVKFLMYGFKEEKNDTQNNKHTPNTI